MSDFERRSKGYLLTTFKRWGWTSRVRPMILGEVILRLLVRSERRRLFELGDGTRLFLDPLSHAGRTILEFGCLEPDTESSLRQYLPAGGSFLDIGANEGVLSALAARLVGSSGLVVAVEPQSQLADLVEVNIRLNGQCRSVVFCAALGGVAGDSMSLNLYPSLNSGASSLVSRYRFSWAREEVEFVGPSEVFAPLETGVFDLVKIDVEGFEGRVVRCLGEQLSEGRVRRLLVDYHAPQLQQLGESPSDIDEFIRGCGFVRYEGEPVSGYAMYERT